MAGKPINETETGGNQNVFLTTHWSLIENIVGNTDKDQALITSLMQTYWKPVYYFLRYKGYNNEDAKDITQGFFHEVVLNRNLIQRADQSKGRFRTFLLHALNQYHLNCVEKRNAKMRIPSGKLVSLESGDVPDLPAGESNWGPEDAYHYAWLSSLLDHVLCQVKQSCLARKMEVHWKVFQDRVAAPTLNNMPPPSLGEVCQRHGIDDTAKASNMILTVKRRFQALLKQHIRQTVISEREIPDEIEAIMRSFSNSP